MANKSMNKFNLRAYGILINDKNEVLLSSELRYGKSMIKFPGGGLEFGEGLVDCLKREFQEECGVDVEVGELFYVNDFVQVSAFHSDQQLISFYYKVSFPNPEILETVSLDYEHKTDGEKLVWRKLGELSQEDMTFPIDKIVAEKLNKLQ
ncbi:NUDIX domain-containing protein [Crocinitomicaceae bacterium]|nr:NUDIX domain-containing protein [Crocinitomicaceae bacterium]